MGAIKNVLISIVFIFFCQAEGLQQKDDIILDKIKNMTPVMEGLVEDSIYAIVINSGLEALPMLFDNLTNNKKTNIKIYNTNGHYSISQISQQLIEEIIHNAELSKIISQYNGITKNSNLIKLKESIEHWYDKNKDKMILVKYNNSGFIKTPDGKNNKVNKFVVVGFFIIEKH